MHLLWDPWTHLRSLVAEKEKGKDKRKKRLLVCTPLNQNSVSVIYNLNILGFPSSFHLKCLVCKYGCTNKFMT